MWCHEHNPQEPQRSRLPWERDTEQSALTHAHHTLCTSRQLGTTVNRRYDVSQDWLWDAWQLARVSWGTRCKGFCSKEGLHYHCIKQSARNLLERCQVPKALGELSRSCHQTSNNQPWFRSSEIPWGFLAKAVLCWLSGGSCHARKCHFEEFFWGEKVWFALAKWTFAWETFGKRQKGKKPVLILIPGFYKHLALRKRVMCARNIGVHVRHSTSEYLRYEKTGWEIGFLCSQERCKETSK